MRRRLLLTYALLTMLTLSACNDYFDTTGDDNLIVDTKFFSDESAFMSALTEIYTQMRSPHLYGGTLTLGLLEFCAQDLTPYDEATQAAASLHFDHPALSNEIAAMTREAYAVVAACNKLIDAAEHSDVVFFNKDQQKCVTGEAYALRAAVQFDLLRLFHPAADDGFKALPYVTEFAPKRLQPLTTGELLSLINADLKHAEEMLADTDPLLLATNPTSVKVGEMDRRLRTFQLNYFAIKALQARVALWQGDHQQALACAEVVFRHVREVAQRHQIFYYVQPGKYGADYCFSREYVFAISSTPDGFTAFSQELFEKRNVRVTPRLHLIYPEASDIRYRAWFRQTTDGTYSMAQKFGRETLLSGYLTSTTGGEKQLPAAIPYIKLGEVALIAAEALNEMGRTDEALAWIAELEQNKDVDFCSALHDETNKQEALRRLIMEEYERDLFGEGQLFYLYKRLSANNNDYNLPLPETLMQVAGTNE